MNKVTVRGQSGEIRWSYHKAADLTSWEVFGSTLTARVVNGDAFRLSQGDLVFVVPRPSGAWRWPILNCQVDGASLTATVKTEE